MQVRLAPGLGELAEADAIRQRYDARNVGVVGWVVRFALFLSIVAVRGPMRWPLVAVLAPLVLLFARLRGRARNDPATWLESLDPLASRLEPWRRGLCIGTYICIYIAFVTRASGLHAEVDGQEADPLLFFLPWAVLPMLLAASERVLVHACLVLITMVTWTMRGGEQLPEMLTLSCFANLVVGVLGLVLNRSYRKSFVATWSDSRGHFLERRRLEGELGYAREIQLSMLPRESPSLPWLDVAAFSLPAMQVGGDYYDYVLLPRAGAPEGAPAGRVVIVLADVAGHGLASALMVSGLRSAVKLLAPELADGPRAMLRVNTMVRDTAHRHMKVAFSLALLDPEAATVTMTSAGQAPAILWRSATGRAELLELPALPLGSRLQKQFPSATLGLEPGDLLVMSTDGAFDVQNAADESYGADRLVSLLEERGPWAAAAALREVLLTDLWAFKGNRPQEDDVTILVIGMRATAEPAPGLLGTTGDSPHR